MCSCALMYKIPEVPISDFKHPAISRAAAGVKGSSFLKSRTGKLEDFRPRKGTHKSATAGECASWSETLSGLEVSL